MALSTYTNENLDVSGVPVAEQLTAELIDFVPNSWTSQNAKVRGGSFWTLMSGIGLLLAAIRQELFDAKAQFRVATAFDNGLDIVSQDFFGTDLALALPRRIISFGGTMPLEDDTSFRARINAELLRERGTLQGIIKAVTAVTGATPVIVEPFSAQSNAVYADALYVTELTTTVNIPGSLETKLYVASTTNFPVNSRFTVNGYATAFTVSAIGSDGNGPFITPSPSFTVGNVPPSNSIVTNVGTLTNAGSTTTVVNVPTTTGLVLNDQVVVQGFAPATQVPTFIVALTANVSITLSTALSAAPGTSVAVRSLGKRYTYGVVGVYSSSNNDVGSGAMGQYLNALVIGQGSTDTVLKVVTNAGTQVGDRVFVNGFATNNRTVTAIPDGQTLNLSGSIAGAPSPGTLMFTTSFRPWLGFGADAFGDVGVKYTFIVNVTANPLGAALARIIDVVERVRPAGVRGIVTLAA